mgnify:CR=1 FL=1
MNMLQMYLFENQNRRNFFCPYLLDNMCVEIIAVESVKTDAVGNFAWMVKQTRYSRALFLYLDVEEELMSVDADFGYNELRKYNGIRSFSIGVCSKVYGCYSCLNTFTRQIVDIGFRRIADAIATSNYDTVYFSTIDKSEHAFLGDSVIKYIMRKLQGLSNSNIKMLVKKQINI